MGGDAGAAAGGEAGGVVGGGSGGGGSVPTCVAGGAVNRDGVEFTISVPPPGNDGGPTTTQLCQRAAIGSGLSPEFRSREDRSWYDSRCGFYLGPNTIFPIGGCTGPFLSCGPRDEHGRPIDAGSSVSTVCLGFANAGARMAIQGPGKRLFVSREVWPGSLGGLQGADVRCRDVAADAGLANPASFRAFLGGGSVSAAARFSDGGPWSTPAGVFVFRNSSSFATTPIAGLDRDEFGEPLDGGLLWTGSGTWLTATGADCANWTASTMGGTVGRLGVTTGEWVNATTLDCAQAAHLLCLEQ